MPLKPQRRAYQLIKTPAIATWSRAAVTMPAIGARSHIALRIVLELHARLRRQEWPYDIEFARAVPRLAATLSLDARPYFSLAHAGGHAVIAISQPDPSGSISKRRGASTSAPGGVSVLSGRRRLSLAVLPIEATTDAGFLQAWVRLEAVAKGGRPGIGRLLTRLGIVGATTPPPLATAASPLQVRDLMLPTGHVAAVAASHLPGVIAVDAFPNDAPALAQFLGHSRQ